MFRSRLSDFFFIVLCPLAFRLFQAKRQAILEQQQKLDAINSAKQQEERERKMLAADAAAAATNISFELWKTPCARTLCRRHR